MNFKKVFLSFLITFFLIAPLFVCMAEPEFSTTSCSDDTLCSAIEKIQKYVEMVGAVVIGMIIVIGGFMYATGGGNEKQLGTAKSMITCAVIGMVIILAVDLIITTVKNLLELD